MSAAEIVQVLGDIGDFLGSIGVLATLVYLSVQVRESRKVAQFAAVQANRSERIAWFISVRDSPYIEPIQLKVASGAPLTEEEEGRLGAHCSGSWALTYSEWVQREVHAAGEYATRDEAHMQIMVTSQTQMSWWREFGVKVYPDAFVRYVEAWSSRAESAA